MVHLRQDLIITLFGFISSMIVAVGLLLIEKYLQLSLYSFTVGFILPIGAIFSGIAAASGYYFAIILFNQKPSWVVLANMLFASVGTFFLIYWVSYYLYEIEGISIRNIIPFSSYLQAILQNQKVEFGIGGKSIYTTGKLGSMGYIFAFIQIVGFAMGGLYVYFVLSEKQYCAQCNKYYKTILKQNRYSNDPKQFVIMVDNLNSLIHNNQIREALTAHNGLEETKITKDTYLRSEIEIKECPSCHTNLALSIVYKMNDNNDWMPVNELCYAKAFKSNYNSIHY